MAATSRLDWLESQLDRDDLTAEQFEAYNREANELQDAKNIRVKKREEEREALRKEMEQEKALERALSLTEEEVEKMYVKFHKNYVSEYMSYEEWLNKSTRYYTINEDHSVTSRARSNKTQETVPCVSVADAKMRILSLIKIKFYDHFVKGYNFAWDIEEENHDLKENK